MATCLDDLSEDFDVEGKECPRKPNNFEYEDLKVLLNENQRQTLKELA